MSFASASRPALFIIFSSFNVVLARISLILRADCSGCSSSLFIFFTYPSSSESSWYFLFSLISFSCLFLCLLSSGKYRCSRVAFKECKSVVILFPICPSSKTLVTPKSKISLILSVDIYIEESSLMSSFLFPRVFCTF